MKNSKIAALTFALMLPFFALNQDRNRVFRGLDYKFLEVLSFELIFMNQLFKISERD